METFGQVRLSVDARLGTRRTAFSGRSLTLKPTIAGEWIALPLSCPWADALSPGRTRRCVVRCNTHPGETPQGVLIAGIPHGIPVRLSNAKYLTGELSGHISSDPGANGIIADYESGRGNVHGCVCGARRGGKVNPSVIAEPPFIPAPSEA